MATSRKRTTTARSRTTTARKRSTATGRSAAGRKTTASPKVVKLSPATEGAEMLRKKELIEKVVERSGVRRRDVRPAVEALLELLGETLDGGRDVNLPPLGKLRVHRIEEKENARIVVCKLRRGRDAGAGGDEGGKDPLAEAAD